MTSHPYKRRLHGQTSLVSKTAGYCWRIRQLRGTPPSDAVEPSCGRLFLSSNLLVGPRMAVSFGVELPGGLVDSAVEVIRAGEGLVSEVMPLQVAPDRFDVVELWGVFRQPLDPEPVGALGERGAARLAGVDRAVIQDKHDRLDRNSELGAIAPIDLLQEGDEV